MKGDGFHPRHSFSGLGELRMIEPKFPFRQFFDFRFSVNASRFLTSPTLSKRCAICAIRVVRWRNLLLPWTGVRNVRKDVMRNN
jgi:hypothetical protein